MMNQVVIPTVGHTHQHTLMMMVMNEVLLLLLLLKLLLSPELYHFPVRVGVLRRHKRRAGGGPVLGHEPTRLVPDSASVAEGLGAHWARSPLRGLLRRAMQAPAHLSADGQIVIGIVTLSPLGRLLLGRVRDQVLVVGGGGGCRGGGRGV